MNLSWLKPKPKEGLVVSQLSRLYQDTARRFGLRGRACRVSVKAQLGLPATNEQEFLEKIAVLIHALVLADDLDGAVVELKKLRDTPLDYGQ